METPNGGGWWVSRMRLRSAPAPWSDPAAGIPAAFSRRHVTCSDPSAGSHKVAALPLHTKPLTLSGRHSRTLREEDLDSFSLSLPPQRLNPAFKK